MPVLLVRPATSAPEASSGSPAETGAAVEEETEPFVGEEPQRIEAETVLEAVPVDETYVVPVEPVREAAEVQEGIEPVEPVKAVGDAAIAEAMVEEAEVGGGVPEALRADEVVAEEPPESSLREALLRTTEQMNSEGIETPESASLEPTPEISVAQGSAAAPGWPWAPSAELHVEVAPDIANVYSSLDEIEPEHLGERRGATSGDRRAAPA